MINSDNDQILAEIANSVAVVYGWKGFYAPEVRKLVALLAAVATSYAGEYRSEQPALRIIIRQKDNGLELSARGGNTFEKLYFASPTSFFILSSPDARATLLTDDAGKVTGLQLMQNGKIQFTAEKQ